MKKFKSMLKPKPNPTEQLKDWQRRLRQVSRNIERQIRANNDEQDEKAKAPVVQQKGRFKVTSESVDLEKAVPVPLLQKSHSLQVISMTPANYMQPALPSTLPPSPLTSPSDVVAPALPGYSIYPYLNNILQTNIIQRENILSIIKQQTALGDFTANRAADGGSTQATNGIEKSLSQANERETELLHEIADLHKRIMIAHDELQKLKLDPA